MFHFTKVFNFSFAPVSLLALTLALSVVSISCSTSPANREIASTGFTGVRRSKNESYPIQVVGGDESSFTPSLSPGAVRDPGEYDAIVVGAGLAGLSASVYLTDQHLKILVLEKEAHLGGLAAAGESINGVAYDRGAAYWTDSFPEEQAILDHIGLKRYVKDDPIPEPIDSYLLNGILYGASPNEGIWDDRTLGTKAAALDFEGKATPVLPASFAVFKYELQMADKESLIPNQPFEEFKNMKLDSMDAAQWIRQMASSFAKRAKTSSDKQIKLIESLYKADLRSGRLSARDPMKDVVDLMDLYCRSALGSTSEKVSAMAFANFYISEIVTRYTTQVGTGKAAEQMKAMLEARPEFASLKMNAPVAEITDLADGAEVKYLSEGHTHIARGRYLVYSAQLGMAPKHIKDFSARAPAQAKLMSELGYSHYSVHGVEVTGHPYRVSYDTWVHPKNYDPNEFSDFIIGRRMDPAIHGYVAGDLRKDYSTNPDSKGTIFTIYHPASIDYVGKYTDKRSAELAEEAVNRLDEVAHAYFKQDFKITRVSTNRWPFSVHVAAPGHYKNKAKILRKPFGHIYFGNNNLGTPAFEEALFRGHCAADNVLAKIQGRTFKREPWSQCPIE